MLKNSSVLFFYFFTRCCWGGVEEVNRNMLKFLIMFFLVFLLGIGGIFLARKHMILLLLSLELLLLAINLSFACFSVYLDDVLGQLLALFLLMIAASESALGLAILVVYYRLRGLIFIDLVTLLKS